MNQKTKVYFIGMIFTASLLIGIFYFIFTSNLLGQKMVENKNFIEDEIDLKELFQIIWNKKMLIIFFTLFTTIISGLYIYSKTPIYEVKSYVEIGFIDKKNTQS